MNDIRPVLNQAEIEHMIVDTAESLELLVEEYAAISERAGTSEVDFKRIQALTVIRQIENPLLDKFDKPRKMLASERDARVEIECNDARRVAAIAASAREVARESMSTHRTRIDALRTLAANVRYHVSDR